MEDGVEGAGGLGGDGFLAHAGERSEGSQTRGHLSRPVRVDGRPAAVVSRVEGGQDVAHFGASALSQDEAVGAHAHSRAHEVGQGDGTSPLDVWLAFEEVDAVRVGGGDLGDLLDAHDALAGGDEGEGGAQEGRFATAGGAGDEDVGARGDERAQERAEGARQGAARDEVPDAQPTRAEHAQGDERSRPGDGWQDRVQADAPGQGAVGDGAGVVEARPARARQPDRGVAGVGLVADADVDARESASPIDPRAGTVDEHVGDARVVDEAREGRVHPALPGTQGLEGVGGFARATPGSRRVGDRPGGSGAVGEESQGAMHGPPPGAQSRRGRGDAHTGASARGRRGPGGEPADRGPVASARAGSGAAHTRTARGYAYRDQPTQA